MGYIGFKTVGHSGFEHKTKKAYYTKVKSMMLAKKTKDVVNKDIRQYSFQELQKGRTQHKQTNFRKMLKICIPWAILLIVFICYIHSNFSG